MHNLTFFVIIILGGSMKNFFKILFSIIGFIILLYVYAATISLILIYPVGLIMGWDSSGWVLCLIISFVISPILSFISIRKIFRNKETKSIDNKEVDKLYEDKINKL